MESAQVHHHDAWNKRDGQNAWRPTRKRRPCEFSARRFATRQPETGERMGRR